MNYFVFHIWQYPFDVCQNFIFSANLHTQRIFLVLSGKTVFLFPENMILFFRRKMKDDLSQKTHGNVIFSLYLVKVVLLFPINMILTFYYPIKKAKIIFLKKKINLKMTFLVSQKKMIFILENMAFLLIEKLKIDKKSLLSQIRIRRTSVINVNSTSNKFLITKNFKKHHLNFHAFF